MCSAWRVNRRRHLPRRRRRRLWTIDLFDAATGFSFCLHFDKLIPLKNCYRRLGKKSLWICLFSAFIHSIAINTPNHNQSLFFPTEKKTTKRYHDAHKIVESIWLLWYLRWWLCHFKHLTTTYGLFVYCRIKSNSIRCVFRAQIHRKEEKKMIWHLYWLKTLSSMKFH